MELEDIFEKLNSFIFLENLGSAVDLEKRPDENGIFLRIIPREERRDYSTPSNDVDDREERISLTSAPASKPSNVRLPASLIDENSFALTSKHSNVRLPASLITGNSFPPFSNPSNLKPPACLIAEHPFDYPREDDDFGSREDEDDDFGIENQTNSNTNDSPETATAPATAHATVPLTAPATEPATNKSYADEYAAFKPSQNALKLHCCSRCPMVFNTVSKLVHHRRKTHSDEKRVSRKQVCLKCNLTFNDRTALMKHWWKVHKVHSCFQCSEVFPDANSRKKHEAKVHNRGTVYEDSLYECQRCPFTTRSKWGIMSHRKVFHGVAKYSCSWCAKLFKTTDAVERHVNGVHLNLRPFQCKLCLKGLPDVFQLRRHEITRHPYPCDMCELKLTTLEKRQRHAKEAHGVDTGAEVFPASCQACSSDVTFSCRAEYLEHKLMHAKASRRGRLCPFCEDRFKTIEALRSHVKSVHDRDGHQCESCEYFSFNEEALQKHVKANHEGKTYPCPTCFAHFSSRRQREKHRDEAHCEGGKPTPKQYRCAQCEKIFRTARSLQEHSSSSHKFECSRCELKFTLKKSLKNHEEEQHPDNDLVIDFLRERRNCR